MLNDEPVFTLDHGCLMLGGIQINCSFDSNWSLAGDQSKMKRQERMMMPLRPRKVIPTAILSQSVVGVCVDGCNLP